MTVVGVGHSIIFLFAINEAELVRQKEAKLAEASTVNKSEQKTVDGVHELKTDRSHDQFGTWDWFTDCTFYKVVSWKYSIFKVYTIILFLPYNFQCFVYMFARLYINLPVTYLVLYIPETLFLEKVGFIFILN